MSKNKLISGIFLILFLSQAASLYAVKPRFSTHQSKGKFERGKLNNVSILDKGIITLAPQTQKILATGDPFIWSLVSDSKGNVYLGTGNDGKLYKYSVKGDSSVWFDSKELEIYALAIDKNDNIYAGTSPKGCVYKITPDGVSSVYFDPDDMYIWDMAISPNGDLYVATGSKAAIYKITQDGKSSQFFASDQTHIRGIALYNDLVYAGSSGNGYVYKIDQSGKPFVILDTQMQEVHDILTTPDGKVYAAAYGESVTPVPGQKDGQSDSDKDDSQGAEDDEASFAQSFLIENMAQPVKTPTALFRIDTNGYAKDLWIGSDERVQSLALDNKGNVMVGTGNKGKLYRLNAQDKPSLLLTLDESQITAMAPDHDHNLVLGTSNLGTAYWVQPEHVKNASYESEVIDTGLLSLWGTLDWEGKENGGVIKFYTRSGNTEIPEQTWSDWQPLEKKNGTLQIVSPAARFIQWKSELSDKDKSAAPEIHKVTLAYMQKNLPPAITDIIVHRPGDKFEIDISPEQQEMGVPYPQQASKEANVTGYRSIDWLFEDPNFDGLVFDLYYKSKDSDHWATLVKDFANNFYSWDSRLMADGEYEIKIVGSDAPANTASGALTGELVSDPFIIDNTGPVIKSGKKAGTLYTVTITDQWNPLNQVWYSINAGDWERLDPVDQINDSKIEQYQIPLTEGPLEIAIRAEDNVGNTSIVHEHIE